MIFLFFFLQSETLSSCPGLTADCTRPPVSAPMLADIKSECSLNAGQQQLPPYRARSKSLESGLQSRERVSGAYQLASCSDTSGGDSRRHLEPCACSDHVILVSLKPSCVLIFSWDICFLGGGVKQGCCGVLVEFLTVQFEQHERVLPHVRQIEVPRDWLWGWD